MDIISNFSFLASFSSAAASSISLSNSSSECSNLSSFSFVESTSISSFLETFEDASGFTVGSSDAVFFAFSFGSASSSSDSSVSEMMTLLRFFCSVVSVGVGVDAVSTGSCLAVASLMGALLALLPKKELSVKLDYWQPSNHCVVYFKLNCFFSGFFCELMLQYTKKK